MKATLDSIQQVQKASYVREVIASQVIKEKVDTNRPFNAAAVTLHTGGHKKNLIIQSQCTMKEKLLIHNDIQTLQADANLTGRQAATVVKV
jgi:hypothetical protein